MGVKASRVKAMFDTDASVTLRDVASGAVTSTTTETAVSLGELDTAYWEDGAQGSTTGRIPFGVMQVEIDITACDSGEERAFSIHCASKAGTHQQATKAAHCLFLQRLAKGGSSNKVGLPKM